MNIYDFYHSITSSLLSYDYCIQKRKRGKGKIKAMPLVKLRPKAEYDERKIVKIQTAFRSHIARKRFKELRKRVHIVGLIIVIVLTVSMHLVANYRKSEVAMQQRQRTFIIKELVNTEEVYLNQLNSLIQVSPLFNFERNYD